MKSNSVLKKITFRKCQATQSYITDMERVENLMQALRECEPNLTNKELSKSKNLKWKWNKNKTSNCVVHDLSVNKAVDSDNVFRLSLYDILDHNYTYVFDRQNDKTFNDYDFDLSPFVEELPNMLSSSAVIPQPILFNLTTITSISFHDCPTLTDSIICKFLHNSSGFIPITKLTFSHCNSLTDELGNIISHYNHVSRLNDLHFQSCKRIGDMAIQYLISDQLKKGKVSINSITISRCPLVTGKGMIALIKHQYRSLSSIDFSSDKAQGNVTDKVLLVLADQYNSASSSLAKVNFSGSQKISDIGVQEFVSRSSNVGASQALRELYLSHCPGITSSSIRSFYKSTVLYGTKKNKSLENLEILHLEGNKNLFVICIYWIGKSCPNLKELNLKECHFKQLKRAAYKKHNEPKLKLQIQTKYHEDLRYISSLASLSNLTILDLHQCKGLMDDQVIIDLFLKESTSFRIKGRKFGDDNSFDYVSMDYLDLSGMLAISNANIEKILELNSSLSYFGISGCQKITDKSIYTISTRLNGLRCLALSNLVNITNDAIDMISKLCAQTLTELDISQNNQLTSCSMKNFDRFLTLMKLNISHCSRLNDKALKWLPKMSLRQLFADGLPQITDKGIEYFCKRHKECNIIQYLSFRYCTSLSSYSVRCVHKYCSELTFLDISGTNCTITITDFREAKGLHDSCSDKRYVQYELSEKFCGLNLTPQMRDKKIYDLQKNRNDAVRLIQFNFRSHVTRRKRSHIFAENKRIRRKEAILRMTRFLKIQVQRYRALKKKKAKEKLAVLLQQLYWTMQYRQWKRIVLRKNLKLWIKYKTACHSYQAFLTITYKKKLTRRIFRAWFMIALEVDGNRIKKQQQTATRFWTTRSYGKVFSQWNKYAKYFSQCRKKNRLIFMLVSHTDFYNTNDDLTLLRQADHCRNKNLLKYIWIQLSLYIELKRKENFFLSNAKDLALHLFIQNHGSTLLRNLTENSKRKLKHRALLQSASSHHIWFNKKTSIFWLKYYVTSVNAQRCSSQRAFLYQIRRYRRTKFIKTMKIIVMLQYIRSHQSQIWIKAEQSHVKRRLKMTLDQWNQWKKKEVYFQALLNQSNKFRERALISRSISLWRNGTIYALHVKKISLNLYKSNLYKKSLKNWRNYCISKQEKRHVQELKRRKCIIASIKIQKIYRGWKGRRIADEWETYRNWAVLCCQNQARIFLSKTILEKRRRLLDLSTYVMQERENNSMKDEDDRTKWFLKVEKLVTKIQRRFRGIKGRVSAKNTLQQSIYSIAQEFEVYKEIQLQFMKNQHEKRIWDERKLCEASIILERTIRCFLGRQQLQKLKRKKIECDSVTKIQSLFRGSQSRRLRAALVRHAENLQRRQISRENQAKYLRMLGLKTNITQQNAIARLGHVGLEATSFVQSIYHQKSDIIKDFQEAKSLAWDCWFAFNQEGKNKYKTRKLFRMLLANRHKENNPIPGDAVRIITEAHVYTGMTGQVLYIDKNTLDEEFAVVRMDIDSTCHHFNLKDAKNKVLLNERNLLKIDCSKSTKNFMTGNLENLRENLIHFAENFRRETIFNKAATVIQKKIRMITSRNKVASMRFEHFISTQFVQFANLESINQVKLCSPDSGAWLFSYSTSYLNFNLLIFYFPKVQQVVTFFKNLRLIRLEVHGIKKKKMVEQLLVGTPENQSLGTMCSSRIRKQKAQRYLSIHTNYGLAIYKGEFKKEGCWRSIPHGFGCAYFIGEFRSGFEEKTLNIVVKRAQGLTSSIYFENPDPFVEIHCNSQNVRTTAKIKTTNPVWNEAFEINVNNSNRKLKIILFDWKRNLRKDFLGQVVISLTDLDNRGRVKKWFKLEGYEKGIPYAFFKKRSMKDLGMIELEFMLSNRKMRDDSRQGQIQYEACITLQCWIRSTFARKDFERKKNNRREEVEYITRQLTCIQCQYRVHRSRKMVKTMTQTRDSITQLQNFIRCTRACTNRDNVKLRYFGARTIQCAIRKWRSTKLKNELKTILSVLKEFSAITIQSNYRRYSSSMIINQMRKLEITKNIINVDNIEMNQSLIKRLDRICKRLFVKILSISGSILWSPYGEVTLKQFVRPSQDGNVKPEMLKVFLFGHKPLSLPKNERQAIHSSSSRYSAAIRVRDIDRVRTIGRCVQIIQCFFRNCLALSTTESKRLLKKSTLSVKRRFYCHKTKKNKLALHVQKLYRIAKAKNVLRIKKVKNANALTIQCAVRSYFARSSLENLREITCTVVNSSSFLNETFCASKVIDSRNDTFWCTQYGFTQFQWIIFDLKKEMYIERIKILAPNVTSSPKAIDVIASNDCIMFQNNVDHFSLRQTDKWQTFQIQKKSFRFWKLIVIQNFGNSEAITINRVLFFEAREENIDIINQPSSLCIKPRSSKDDIEVELCCPVKSWPLPKYQWCCDGEHISGENSSKLKLQLKPLVSLQCKSFKCKHCLRVNENIPMNIFRVVCFHCKKKYQYDELIEDQTCKSFLLQKENVLSNRIHILQKILDDFDTSKILFTSKSSVFHGPNHSHVSNKNCLQGANKMKNSELPYPKTSFTTNKQKFIIRKIVSIVKRLEIDRSKILRSLLKFDCHKLSYNGEGQYTCIVSHLRNRATLLQRSTQTSIVYVSDTDIYEEIKTRRIYLSKTPKQYIPPKISSIHGSFKDGSISGNVTLKFETGEEYIGPFLENSSTKKKHNHWGLWKSCENTIIEGPSVDNHFDCCNMQGQYQVRYSNDEQYMGTFINGKRHGRGVYFYNDGTIYNGGWYQGNREGIGTLINKDGSAYDGEWDSNNIHGDGIWRWADGASYVGENIVGKRAGRGVFINSNGDRYVGEFSDNEMHGHGIIVYADGSKYVGNVYRNKREGISKFFSPSGEYHLGNWHDDFRNGTFTVTRNIGDHSKNIKMYEIEAQVGVWKSGKFIKWISKSVNSEKTSLFCKKFLDGEEKIDGPYAKQIAKKLPFAPYGVDENDQCVQDILLQIGTENLDYVGKQTYKNTKEQLSHCEWQLDEAKNKTQKLERKLSYIKQSRIDILEIDEKLQQNIESFKAESALLHEQIEAFWINDKSMTRQKFRNMSEHMKKLTKKEWFSIRRYHEPPRILKKLMSGICCVMMVDETWKMARILLGSNANNKRHADKDSLWQKYSVKLLFMLEKFNVYLRVDAGDKLLLKIKECLEDTAISGEDFNLKHYGAAAIKLVEFLRICYLYIQKAQGIRNKKYKLSTIEALLYRDQIMFLKNRDKLKPTYNAEKYLTSQINSMNNSIILLESKKQNLNSLLQSCKSMQCVAEGEDIK